MMVSKKSGPLILLAFFAPFNFKIQTEGIPSGVVLQLKWN